jgi:hypothetical protein
MPKSHQISSNSTDTGSSAVDSLMEKTIHPDKESIQTLRALILSLDSRIQEEVKWNAPSFFIEDHFATFKFRPLSSIQLVLHTGAKVKVSPKPFEVPDPQGLLVWAAKDHCILTLRTAEDIRLKHDAVAAIIKTWIQQLDLMPAQGN